MLIKLIIGALLVFMIYNLFTAGVVMLKDNPDKPSMTKFIGRRVLTSAIIVIVLLVAIATGLITPNPRPY